MSVFAAAGAAPGAESGSVTIEHYEPVTLGDPDTPRDELSLHPTRQKIYSDAGPGDKFTQYNNDDALHQQGMIGNCVIADNDMIFVRNRLWYVQRQSRGQ